MDDSVGWVPSWLHTGLDMAGLVPGYGEFADLINAGLYATEGDWGNAAISALSMVPVGGQAAVAARYLGKYGPLSAKGARELLPISGNLPGIGHALSDWLKLDLPVNKIPYANRVLREPWRISLPGLARLGRMSRSYLPIEEGLNEMGITNPYVNALLAGAIYGVPTSFVGALPSAGANFSRFLHPGVEVAKTGGKEFAKQFAVNTGIEGGVNSAFMYGVNKLSGPEGYPQEEIPMVQDQVAPFMDNLNNINNEYF